MDALEGRSDYTLDVAVVDLSEKEEQEQIVFFNNPDVMGTYNFKGLRELLPQVGFAQQCRPAQKLPVLPKKSTKANKTE